VAPVRAGADRRDEVGEHPDDRLARAGLGEVLDATFELTDVRLPRDDVGRRCLEDGGALLVEAPRRRADQRRPADAGVADDDERPRRIAGQRVLDEVERVGAHRDRHGCLGRVALGEPDAAAHVRDDVLDARPVVGRVVGRVVEGVLVVLGHRLIRSDTRLSAS
jgi:hypothetical protein